MNYTELMRKIIEDSGLSIRKVWRTCQNQGMAFAENYINMLLGDDGRIASPEISRAIARACGVHEQTLILQAYYDKAPEEFKVLIDSVFLMTGVTMLHTLRERHAHEDVVQSAEELLRSITFAEILDSIDEIKASVDNMHEAIAHLGVNDALQLLDQQQRVQEQIVMPDDAMSPTIPKGGKIHVEPIAISACGDGEILAFVDESGGVLIREVQFMNGGRAEVFAIAHNPGFKNMRMSLATVSLLGRVASVTVDFPPTAAAVQPATAALLAE